MKKRVRVLAGVLIAFSLLAGSGNITYANDELDKLYARSAVLMDADSGRILFEKNGYEVRPNASTTKIMTCILALESGKTDAVVAASGEACAQPKVHLGMQKGEQFYVRDLLYSLMLESHNDSAVAIAEAVAGSVPEFAAMMNAKAKEIGCDDTYFITPNGLDASDGTGVHSLTAADLARIMRYCINLSPQKEEFLKITQTKEYQFSDVEGKRTFSCINHNAFLSMMEGALSGKTGFTSDAGYCYVGALKRGDKMFIVALLACGWPNNKGYKWTDTRRLMEYGLEAFEYRDVYKEQNFPPVRVEGGVPDGRELSGTSTAKVAPAIGEHNKSFRLLMKDDDDVIMRRSMPDFLRAPVSADEKVGNISYYLNGVLVYEEAVVTKETVGKRDFEWCAEQIKSYFFMKN